MTTLQLKQYWTVDGNDSANLNVDGAADEDNGNEEGGIPTCNILLRQMYWLNSNRQCSDWAGLGWSRPLSRIAHAQQDDRPGSTCWDRTKPQLGWAGPSDETGPDRTSPVSHFNWPTRPRCSPSTGPVDRV